MRVHTITLLAALATATAVAGCEESPAVYEARVNQWKRYHAEEAVERIFFFRYPGTSLCFAGLSVHGGITVATVPCEHVPIGKLIEPAL